MKNIVQILFTFLVFISASPKVLAQTYWDTAGNSIVGTEILGSLNNVDVSMRRDNLQRIILRRFNHPGYNALALSNNVNRVMMPLSGLGGPGALTNQGFSILHMGTTPNENLRRPWLNIGTTYTGGSDIFYVGLLQSPKPESSIDHVDAVLAWGCNETNADGVGPDNFRILFYKPTEAMPIADANEDQGRECVRITPFGNMGVGDFSHMPNGLDEQPTQRLDVNGTARLRMVPSNTPNVLLTGVGTTTGDYVVNHLAFNNNINTFLAGDGTWQPANSLCDWNIVNSGQDVATGYTGACVEGNVLIGNSIGPLESKLFVVKQVPQATVSHIGAEVRLVGGLGDVRGVVSNASGQTTTTQTVGVFGTALTGQLAVGGRFEAGGEQQSDPMNVGVVGRGFNTGGANLTVGVYGRARNMSCGARVIGLYGQALAGTDWTENTPACGQGWALLTCGPVGTTAVPIVLSDQSLKTDINEISGATEILIQLKPKTYVFNDEAINQMGTPAELQYGFLAQEVEQILPHLVGEIPGPIDIDNPNDVSETYKGIRYDEFIPILVAGFQEQQTTINAQQEAIAAQQAQIETLTALVNHCCASGSDKSLTSSGSAGSNSTGSFTEPADFDLQIEKATLDQNVPNPFQYETTITYRIPAQAMVRVRILSQSGQQIDTLVDGLMPKGEYKIIWNASHLPAGMYYYTLEADGVELVKKAVKL